MLISKHHMGWTSAKVTFAWAEYQAVTALFPAFLLSPAAPVNPRKHQQRLLRKIPNSPMAAMDLS